LTLYFLSTRNGTEDLFVTTRASTSDPFAVPTPLTELDTAASEADPWVSADNRHIYFTSDARGIEGIYEATR
jgi:Tol biopolymer transport system component